MTFHFPPLAVCILQISEMEYHCSIVSDSVNSNVCLRKLRARNIENRVRLKEGPSWLVKNFR